MKKATNNYIAEGADSPRALSTPVCEQTERLALDWRELNVEMKEKCVTRHRGKSA